MRAIRTVCSQLSATHRDSCTALLALYNAWSRRLASLTPTSLCLTRLHLFLSNLGRYVSFLFPRLGTLTNRLVTRIVLHTARPLVSSIVHYLRHTFVVQLRGSPPYHPAEAASTQASRTSSSRSRSHVVVHHDPRCGFIQHAVPRPVGQGRRQLVPQLLLELAVRRVVSFVVAQGR